MGGLAVEFEWMCSLVGKIRFIQVPVKIFSHTSPSISVTANLFRPQFYSVMQYCKENLHVLKNVMRVVILINTELNKI